MAGCGGETIGAKDARLVDSPIASFHALDGTNFYAIGPDGQLWRETGDVAGAAGGRHHVAASRRR